MSVPPQQGMMPIDGSWRFNQSGALGGMGGQGASSSAAQSQQQFQKMPQPVPDAVGHGPWVPEGGYRLHPQHAGLASSGQPLSTPFAPQSVDGSNLKILGVSAPRPASPQELEELHRLHPGSTPDLAQQAPIYSDTRVHVKLPRAKYHGSPEFYGGIPKRDATFAWAELCATQSPDHSLAPVPQVATKQWYNTYLYVPEEPSHTERQFLERFVQGPDGEWVDVVKARRMTSYLSETREKAMVERMERAMVMSGHVHETRYTDPYSGAHLLACRGELVPRQHLEEQYHTHYSHDTLQQMVSEGQGFDFDNLRVPWPFGRIDRNKQVSQHAYDWFDRQNPYIPTDKSFEFLELPSMFIDKQQYEKYGSEQGLGDYAPIPWQEQPRQGGVSRVQYVNM